MAIDANVRRPSFGRAIVYDSIASAGTNFILKSYPTAPQQQPLNHGWIIGGEGTISRQMQARIDLLLDAQFAPSQTQRKRRQASRSVNRMAHTYRFQREPVGDQRRHDSGCQPESYDPQPAQNRTDGTSQS